MTMSYTDFYQEQEIVFYTDGLCFTTDRSPLPGIKKRDNKYTDNPNKSSMFCIEEGIWWIPCSYRICIYSPREITAGDYLDITKRIEVPANIFLLLEEEEVLRQDPIVKGGCVEKYYDLTFMKESDVLIYLETNLSLITSGNLPHWKNQIQIMDKIYG